MSQATATRTAAPPSVTPALAFLLALACGLIVANLYYAQPLTGLIGTSLQFAPATTGLLVTMTQLGYGLGLLAFVPLGDLDRQSQARSRRASSLRRRRCSPCRLPSRAGVFLAATLVVGIACTSVQILLPFAAHFTTDADRGRVIGSLTSGLMLGIMLARPAASFVTYYAGWRAVFAVSAALMGITAAIARGRHAALSTGHAVELLRHFALIAGVVARRADPAPARGLPRGALRKLQPVLDRGSAAARERALWIDPARHRACSRLPAPAA